MRANLPPVAEARHRYPRAAHGRAGGWICPARGAATIADDDLRRSAFGLDIDDTAGSRSRCPGTGAPHPAFADRRPAAATAPASSSRRPGRRRRASWLVLDGVFYQGDVVARRRLPRRHRGLLLPPRVRDHRPGPERDEHVLAVEVACAPQRDRTAKRNITGVFQHWDCIDPTWNPGGLWRPVRARADRPGAHRRLRVLCREADAEPGASVADARRPRQRRGPHRRASRTTVDERPLEPRRSSRLAAGANRVEWSVDVDDPALWWPWALGDQPLHRSPSTVVVDDEPSHDRVRCAPAFRAGGDAQLGAVGQRRAPVPQGRQPRPDAHGAGRGHAGRGRGATSSSPSTPASTSCRVHAPHHPARALRRRRRAGHARLAGPPAAVGLRPQRPQAGRPPGPRGRRPPRPPPVDRRLVRPQRAHRRSTSPPSATTATAARRV